MCCGVVNRGAAIYQGKIIRALMDNHIVALDAKTGKEVWKTKSPAPTSVENGYAMTGAPLVANGVVVVGVAGAEYSHRGFLEGYDPETGKHLWRSYNIPGKGEKGSETWKGDTNLVGGGSSWVTGTYDPELDLVYWGTGNPSPWNPRTREGDALWTNSIIALRPKTGEHVWAYQTTPADPFDYDGVHTPVRRDAQRRGPAAQGGDPGQPRRLPLCARRDERQASGRQRLRQGQLGRRRRPEDRASEVDAGLSRRARRQERHRVAVGVRRHQLAAHVVQSGNRAALHQHAAHRHDLRGAGAAGHDAGQAVGAGQR